MPKATISRVVNGEKIIISEREITVEQAAKIKQSFADRQVAKKKRMEVLHKNTPAIHWEILRYANHHNKDEVLAQYPEHEAFINSIIWPETHN